MAKINLTTTTIEALKTGGTVGDPLTPGLSVERLRSGKLVWQYNRRIPARDTNRVVNVLAGKIVRMAGGSYPATSIAAAREWAGNLNGHVEAGRDPREVQRETEAQAVKNAVTFADAWKLYIQAVERNEHRVTRKVRQNPIKPRTILDKRKMYNCHLGNTLGTLLLRDITTDTVNALIMQIGKTAPIQANRNAAELKVIWKWIMGVRGRSALGVTIEHDPTRELDELWHAESERKRWLQHDELPLFLRAVAQMPIAVHRRGLILLLLTGCRKMEIMQCPTSDVRDGILTITSERAKNGIEHNIALGPWGRAMAETDGEWLIQARYNESALDNGWDRIVERVRVRMEKLSGRTIEHLVPHDLRRTMRSHIEEHGIDEALAERMMNHKLKGIKATYNRNLRAAAMADGFARWDRVLADMAWDAGVGDALGVPPITIEADSQATPEPQSV